MLTAEQSGGNERIAVYREVNQKVIDRNMELASQAGDLAAGEAKRFLDGFDGPSGILTAEQIEQITADKREKAKLSYLTERSGGQRNDTQSLGKGLLAIVARISTITGDLHTANWHGTPEISIDETIDEIIKTTKTGDTETKSFYSLHHLGLPEGAYNQIGNRVDFYVRANVLPYGRLTERRGRFSIATSSVVRISGLSGEFWQNPDFATDNTEELRPAQILDTLASR